MSQKTRKGSPITVLTDGHLAFLVPVALLLWFWAPNLWNGRLLIHGDSAHHGLSLIWLLGQALSGHDALLWSSRIFGGHPLFAEGQGGFANPVNLLAAALFEPVRALGFVHWLSMAIGSGGIFCLCRMLGIGRWSATFAAVAVVFSAPWISDQHNLPMSATLAWAPWLIAACEYWLKRPTALRAAWMACAVALMVFGGYPQLTHGAVIYVLASLLVMPFQREGRAFLAEHWCAILSTSLLAVLLAAGLAAIQLVPLLELVGLSQRSQGIGAYFNGRDDFAEYLRGMLFFYLGDDPAGVNIMNIASMATMLLAGLVLFFRMPWRLPGHLLAFFLLFNLGIGYISPLFCFIYDHHLIPGLHYFRTTYSYNNIALIGLAVAAATMIDALSGPLRPALRGMFQNRPAGIAGLSLYGAGFAWLCHVAYAPLFSKWYFLAPVLLLLAFPILSLAGPGQRRWFPLCAVLIITIDVTLLHMHDLRFYDRSVTTPPEPLRALAAEPDRNDYRTMDISPWGAMTLWTPLNPEMAHGYRRMLAALIPFPTALMWRVPSINGTLALPLGRRSMLDSVFEAELKGETKQRPGLRLLDIHGVRHIASGDPLTAPGLTSYWTNPADHVYIYRNLAARPRFQVYSEARSVATPEQALAGLQTTQTGVLFVEAPAGEIPLSSTEACVSCTAPRIEIVEARPMRYKVNIDSADAGWLFLADASYPGWEATVNDARRPLYAAQVLGKAVPLKAGRNEVTIRYVPRAFYLGAALSGASILLVLLLIWRGIRNRRTPEHDTPARP